MAGPLVLGVLLGLAWWVLAPTAPVEEAPGQVLTPTAPEVRAAQDGTFVLGALVAGTVCGAGLGLRPGSTPTRRSVAVLLGSVLGALLAWRLGMLLGPPSLAAQRAAGTGAPVTPLQLSSPGALLVWPVVAMLLATVAHAAAAWRTRPRHRAALEAPAAADRGHG